METSGQLSCYRRERERERARTVRDHRRDLLSGIGSILRQNGALVADSYGEISLASMMRS